MKILHQGEIPEKLAGTCGWCRTIVECESHEVNICGSGPKVYLVDGTDHHVNITYHYPCPNEHCGRLVNMLVVPRGMVASVQMYQQIQGPPIPGLAIVPSPKNPAKSQPTAINYGYNPFGNNPQGGPNAPKNP